MKKMQKFLSIILALSMAFVLAIPALAADGTESTNPPSVDIDTDSDGDKSEYPSDGTEDAMGTIEITNVKVGKTYTLYRVFDLNTFSQVSGAYSYKIAEGWDDFFKTNAAGADYITIENGYAVWKDEQKDPQDFAQAALKYALDKKTAGTDLAVDDYTVLEGVTKFTFDVLDTTNSEDTVKDRNEGQVPLGYYLVDSTVGALCNLTSTDFSVQISEKNDVPGVDKKIVETDENETEVKKDACDGDVGDTVNFEASVHVKPGAQGYVFHDKMDNGLALQENTIKVYFENNEITANATETFEIVKPGSNCTGGCTFEIKFADKFLEAKAGKDVVIKYSATIDSDAVVGIEGNTNDSWLKYGDSNESTHSSTETYTWEFPVIKTDKDKQPLAGAEFELRTSTEANAEALKFVYNESTHTYRLALSTEASNAKITTCVKTDADHADLNGKFILSGLDTGTYYLYETKAPDGYNKLEEPLTITITAQPDSTDSKKMTATITASRNALDGEVDTADGNNADNKISYTLGTGEGKVEEFTVVNLTGTELPSTGGMGTTIFYIAGSIMVLGAVILMVTKKKMINR